MPVLLLPSVFDESEADPTDVLLTPVIEKLPLFVPAKKLPPPKL